ncbi:ABC transporter ATP-binding protein [Desulfopila inferna]|uniref:ABC transporter ATP-binding protein n=1 Tax=Desulfopila inferna TaxID=468528 RepID=UPI001962963D|nr:ABC transporter ATP-binding protein [Desulfopila inferna]MBM9604402.1 ATP-binding cassette domain-containing protein [Desulfopila inferna]
MTDPLFSVDRLTYLQNGPYSFSLYSNEVVGFTGPSGIGKTQMLRALVESIPYDGTILLDGVKAECFPAPSWRRKVGLVAAESAWWYDDVGSHFNKANGDPELVDILTRLGFEIDVLSWSISRLSTGERQRLALARELTLKPVILLLDEPCSALDPYAVSLVETLLSDYQKTPKTALLWVSHDHDQLKKVAGRCFHVHRHTLEQFWPDPGKTENPGIPWR